MHVKQESWTIKQLIAGKSGINLNPAWQRGPAWKQPRQVLLIDSILRGMDIPKIYLRKLPSSNPHTHDAVDGQQRLRAIWEFASNQLSMSHPEGIAAISGVNVGGMSFSDLPKAMREKFEAFEVIVAEITNASSDEIINLFARLQMGLSLNPAELRNAMLSPLGHVITTIATTHEFFEASKIPEARYKRQDYVTHIFALAAHGATRDIKAPDLKRLFAEFPADRADEVLALSAKVDNALNAMAVIDEWLTHRLTQKWLFVDLCWLVMQELAEGHDVDPVALAEAFDDFERLRRDYTGRSAELIDGQPIKTKQARLNRFLYEYIGAFRAQGATHGNLRIRNAALRAFCF